MVTPQQQMLLDLKPEQPPTLDNFVTGANAELVARLRSLGDASSFEALYIWGPQGCGKSHLLAATAEAARGKRPLVFLQGAEARAEGRPEFLRRERLLEDDPEARLPALADVPAVAAEEQEAAGRERVAEHGAHPGPAQAAAHVHVDDDVLRLHDGRSGQEFDGSGADPDLPAPLLGQAFEVAQQHGLVAEDDQLRPGIGVLLLHVQADYAADEVDNVCAACGELVNPGGATSAFPARKSSARA